MNHAMLRAPRAPFAAALLLATSLTGPALAQSSTQTAQSGTISTEARPVIVESTRIPTELDKTGAAVTVITAEDIARAQDRQITDTLRRVPGLNVTQNGAFGAQSSVFLRGAASEQTLVRIDGVEVNDPSTPGGGFDFGGLDASNIEKIEVLRGPQSTLYGSDAIGGVIDITTKSGREGFAANAFLEGGSFGTVRGSGTVRGGTERARGSLTVSGTETNGISAAEADNGNDEKDGFTDVSVATKGSVDLGENVTVSGALNLADQTQEIDGFSFATGLPADNQEESASTRINGRLSATHTALDGRLENRVSLKTARIDRRTLNGSGATTFDGRGERNTIAYQGTLDATDWLVVTAGAERQESTFTTTSPQRGTRSSGARSVTSGYGLVQVSPIERVTLTGGLRHDASESFANQTTARVSGAVDVPETGTTLRGVWGEGFKAPTVFQRGYVCSFCAGPPVPNSDLAPETSTSWEVGVDQKLLDGRVDASVTYFNQDIDDLIDFNTGGRGYENIAETEQQGVETSLTARVTGWATISGSYTYLDAVNVADDDQLDRRPRHKASTSVRLAPTDRLDLSGTATYRGKAEDGQATLDDVVLVDVRGSYKVTERASVFGRIENLLDSDYQVVEGFGQPGIAGFAGVRVSF